MSLIAFNTNIKLQIFNNTSTRAPSENIKYMARSISTKKSIDTSHDSISMEEQKVRSWIKQCFISFLKTFIDVNKYSLVCLC